MRILVISQMFPCKRHPTSAIFFANLIRKLALKVEELTVVTPRPYIPKMLTKVKKSWAKWYLDPMLSNELNMEIIRPYFFSFRGMPFEGINGILMHLSLFQLIKRLVKKKKIDLILGYNMIPEGIAAVRLAKALNLPVGFWAIGSDVNNYEFYNAATRYLAKKCIKESTIIFAESLALERSIKNISPNSLNIRTFYKGVDVSNFHDLPPKNFLFRKLSLEENKKYLLFVGRLIYDKGIYELVEAFGSIAQKHPDLNLILIGEEIEKEKLFTMLGRQGISDRVIFKGIVPYKEVAYYMKVAELLVLPTWAEGLPNVVMEAMAIGLPVVATNVGGIPEVLENEVTGLSVPAKNAEKLKEAIIRMLEDKTLREICAADAKKLIYDRFNVNKNVNQLYDLLVGVKNDHSYS
jgi:glycosyltransferase involved in cell wall biosynthesis